MKAPAIKKRDELDEESDQTVDFTYMGGPPQPNPLDYRFMFIVANRWADTGGCWSVIGILVAGGLCLLPMIVYVWIFTR
jgi:hypothetical protein